MKNPFGKPQTVAQWLLSSTCWLLSCVAGWAGVLYLLSGWIETEAIGILFFMPGFVVAHVLIWRHAVVRGWAVVAWSPPLDDDVWLLQLFASLWWALLVVFQLVCGLLLLWIAAIISH